MLRSSIGLHEPKPQGESAARSAPSWDALYAVAEAQQGLFTAQQAAEAGFSNQLLHKHLIGGTIERVRRGIYRLSRFPAAQREQEDLVAAWLWSSRLGVLSHETALQLHELSDVLPAKIHLTVPDAWRARRLRTPDGVCLAYGDVPEDDRQWVGAVPVTTPARSIVDLARARGDAGVIDVAIRQALRRNLAAVADVAEAATYVAGTLEPSEREGTWIVDAFSGKHEDPPHPDWRSLAESFAEQHGAVLRTARYHRDTRTGFLELAWPVSALDSKPTWDELRREAAEAFGWQ